jgi:tetratricopeptide (TPR) repeat protein
VVYSSILAARKKKLHLEIGDAIEDIYKNNLDEYYEALAEHYVMGEGYQKGAEYCRLAARKGEKAASLNDAIAYGEKRVSCLERLLGTEDVEKKIIDTRTTLGLYYAQMMYMAEAKQAVEPVVELALKRDYKRRIAQIYSVMGAYSLYVVEDLATTFKYLAEALKVGEESKDIVSLVLSNFFMAIALAWNCEFDKALSHYQRAFELNMAANSLWGMSSIKSGISLNVYCLQGKIGLAYETSREALRMAEDSGDTYSKAMAYYSHGLSYFYMGLLDEAEKHLLKASDFCDRINYLSWGALANHGLGEISCFRGEYQKAQNYFSKGISRLEPGRHVPSWANLCKTGAALADVMNHKKDIDLPSLYDYYTDNKIKTLSGLMARHIAEILLNIDDKHMSEAEDWVRKAIEVDRKNGTMGELGMAHALYAELLKRKGDLPGAKEQVSKAIEIYRECGADGWLKKAQQDLAAIEKPGRKLFRQTKG